MSVVDDECQSKTTQLFREKFGHTPDALVRCPGRVNLIGEHIDYSDYSVLPMAIGHSTWVAMGKCQERKVFLMNIDPKYPPFELEIGTSFQNTIVQQGNSPKWQHYFLAGWRGILERLYGNEEGNGGTAALAEAKGFCAVVGSQIAPSAGLSSSSALVCAASLATIYLQTGQSFETITKKELAEIATKSERFVGMEGGGMDQACECLAQRGSALRIDFVPTLKWASVQLPPNALFAVVHSGLECNKGATSHYNERVVECRIAAQIIAKKANCLGDTSSHWHSAVRTLRDAANHVDLAGKPGKMLEIVEKYLVANEGETHQRQEICEILGCSDAELAKYCLNANTQNMQQFCLYKRAKHVFSEADRVLEFEEICRKMDDENEALERMAALMNASHKSCAELFECSCPELDKTVQKCLQDGCIGARLTGAGWGGCVVALVRKEEWQKVEANGLKVLFWSEPCGGIELIIK